MPIEKPRVQFLESIRGLAALAVVFYHCTMAFWPYMTDPNSPQLMHVRRAFQLLARSPANVVYSGPFAVKVFFVLSGFVLTYSYFRSPRSEALTGAALRRYVRLVIPVFISVMIAYAMMRQHLFHNVQAAAIDGSTWLDIWYKFSPQLWTNDYNGAVRQGLYGVFFRMDTTYNNPLWTMQWEWAGSLGVYAFIALFGGTRNRWILYLIVGALLTWAMDLLYLFDFLVGMVLCDAYVRFELKEHAFDLGWLAWPLMVLGLVVGGYNGVLPRLTLPIDLQYTRPAAAMLIVGVPLFSAQMRRALQSRPLAWLGRISFGFYLTHVLVLCSVGCAVYVHLRVVQHCGHDTAAVLATTTTLLVSLPAGWAMYYLADLPSIAVGKWIAKHVFMPTARGSELAS